MTHRDEIHPPTPAIVMEALKQAQALIEQGHCTGAAHAVISDQDCWDAMGALAKVCATVRIGNTIIPGKDIFSSAVHTLKVALSPRWESLAEFNDARGQDAVVNLFSRAISIAAAAMEVAV